MTDTVLGPMVLLKRTRHDGSVDRLELPAAMMGMVLLYPNGEYARARLSSGTIGGWCRA